MQGVLNRPLYTPRLRLEPVTPAVAAAARAGPGAFGDAIGAQAPSDWCQASLGLVARSSIGDAPVRAVAVDRRDDTVIGDVRFEPSARAAREFELGYAVARSRRRRGYAVEAAGAVVDWLFADAGADCVIAGCDKGNIGSVRTLRRLGFWLDSTPGTTFWWLLTPQLRAEAATK